MNNSTSSSTFVYFISADSGPVKIGVSDDPRKRLAELQTSHYKKLHLLYQIACQNRKAAFQLETAFHRWYGFVQLRNEWFNIELEKLIADIELFQNLASNAIEVEIIIRSSTLKSLQEKNKERRNNRTSDAQDKIRTHLESHPEDMDLTVRQLAAKLDVGKSTVADVRRLMMTEANHNGHYEPGGNS